MAGFDKPTFQYLVHCRRREDGFDRRGEVCGVQQERVCLRPSDAAVRADLTLERSDLFELGVVAAVDHQVGDRSISINLADLLDGAGPVRLERIIPDHFATGQVAAAVVAEHDRRTARLLHQHEADLGM